jgi:hypothetical protein
VVPAPAAIPAASVTPQTASTDVPQLQMDVDMAVLKLRRLEADRDKWLLRCQSLRLQIADAKDAGRPTYNITVEATKAAQSATAVDTQIIQLETELLDSRKKLLEAMSR